MASRTRRLAGIAAAAFVISAAVPATNAAAALIPCQAVSQSTGSEVAVVLVGH